MRHCPQLLSRGKEKSGSPWVLPSGSLVIKANSQQHYQQVNIVHRFSGWLRP